MNTEPEAYETCPRCDGKMGFENCRHVPFRNVGGLCFLCEGRGSVLASVARPIRARQKAAAERTARAEAARRHQREAQEQALHDAAFDRYGDDYRLAYALSRFHDKSARSFYAHNLVNAYKANDRRRIREYHWCLQELVEAFGLVGLGLEEIEVEAVYQERLPR